ncbi:unnamed protein product [Ilex paraguariensis]|uniref:Uncharacterized protein n=1 Tax=Ilex paraguariensis TaxID=185542 RepID=A0ABC8QX70_9AQUA
MEKPSASRHGRLASIEDPKTLSEEEVNSLVEAAMKVIDIHGREEAEKIFLLGLEPVTTVAKPIGGSGPKICGKRVCRILVDVIVN